jgi:6-phosphogluconolactonase/glucosamine-6-phosphate isomerase/deaminase
MDIRVVDDPARVAAEVIARRLRDAVRRRGTAAIAFSGGSNTPSMLAVLASLDVPWSALQVFQVDERVAPDGHPDRNVIQLDALPLHAEQLHAMPVTETDLEAAAERYAATLPEQFDVVHIGMGDDGHTASWPPGDPIVDSARPVEICGMFNGRMRMTLTPGPVNAARMRLAFVTAADKAPMVARWLGTDRDAAAPIPIERVRRTGTVVVLDGAAGSELHDG